MGRGFIDAYHALRAGIITAAPPPQPFDAACNAPIWIKPVACWLFVAATPTIDDAIDAAWVKSIKENNARIAAGANAGIDHAVFVAEAGFRKPPTPSEAINPIISTVTILKEADPII